MAAYPEFVPDNIEIILATYRMHFDTSSYFEKLEGRGFYPYVDVIFVISEEGYFHVPLLLSPYGYSTYRGS